MAAIGRDVLYESDVVKLLPENVSSEDSVKMVRRYVDTWAMSKLMLLKAGKELSKSDRNVDAQIEDYRRNLLGFRYEKAYIEANLDTVVTDAEIGKYYQDHPANYVFPYSIVKARVARVSPKSPYYEMILGDFDAVEKDDVSRLEKICYDSAERYTDFGGKWIPVSTLAKEIDEDLLTCESEIAHKSLFEKKDYEAVKPILSDIGIYHIAGDSICVNVLEAKVEEAKSLNDAEIFNLDYQTINKNYVMKLKEETL